MFMETVSLNDDAPAASTDRPSASTVVHVDTLESQVIKPRKGLELAVSKTASKNQMSAICQPSFSESDSDSESSPANKKNRAGQDYVAVNMPTGHEDNTGSILDQKSNYHQQQQQQHQPVLAPLRVLTQKALAEDRDYVDATLFSPEVSRHALEVAHRRAKAIASEVKQLMEVDVDVSGPPKVKLSPAEAVSIISGAFVSSIQRAKQLVKPETKEYDLLAGTSPSGGMSKLDDLDTDGDGLQLSPEALASHSKHFCRQKLRPALKRVSAYSTAAALESDAKAVGSLSRMKEKQKKKNILWHEDVLDADEEFCEDDNSSECEKQSLVNDDAEDAVGAVNGSLRPQLQLDTDDINAEYGTPPGRKKRKKLVRSMMRRLTPREKEELYRQRPDLMIVPNWAQKYREDLAGEDTTRWNTGLLGLITGLAVLLLVLVFFVVRQRAAVSAT